MDILRIVIIIIFYKQNPVILLNNKHIKIIMTAKTIRTNTYKLPFKMYWIGLDFANTHSLNEFGIKASIKSTIRKKYLPSFNHHCLILR